MGSEFQSFARSNLVEGLDPVPDLLTFLHVINIGVMATSIHTSWQELTSTFGGATVFLRGVTLPW